MKASLTSVQKGLRDLRHYVAGLEIQWELLSTPVEEASSSRAEVATRQFQQHVGKGVAERRFEYNSIVVSLYGLVEQFVESILRAYANRLSVIYARYSELPDTVMKYHMDLSVALLARLEQQRYRDVLTADGLVANLHSCLSGATPFALNADAFAYHTANFRVDVIDEVFGRINVQNLSQRVRDYHPFSEYVARNFPDRNPHSITKKELYHIPDDLADRRNEVAHGIAANLLSNQILLDYIDFLEPWAEALYGLAFFELLPREIAYRGIALGAPIVVHNNSIVCLELRNVGIKVGDILVAETRDSGWPYLAGEILEIQVDHVNHDEVAACNSVSVGIRVEFHAKSNHLFYVLVE